MRKIIGMMLGMGLVCSANAALILNLNAGELASGQETINGETWNNLSGAAKASLGGGAAISNLKYADDTAATGITVVQSAQGANASDGSGGDYIVLGATWDTMTESILWCNAGSGGSHLTISGLTVGSLWKVDVYGGLKSRYTVPNHETTISVNATSGGDMTYGALWDTHAPVSFASIVADSNGQIIISADKGGIGVLSGATLTSVIPEPATIGMFGLGAIITLLIRRNTSR